MFYSVHTFFTSVYLRWVYNVICVLLPVIYTFAKVYIRYNTLDKAYGFCPSVSSLLN